MRELSLFSTRHYPGLGGDFNVIPEPDDCHDPSAEQTHFSDPRLELSSEN